MRHPEKLVLHPSPVLRDEWGVLSRESLSAIFVADEDAAVALDPAVDVAEDPDPWEPSD